MRIEKSPCITENFKDIPVGTICYDNLAVSNNIYIKVSNDDEGHDTLLLCLDDGRTLTIDDDRKLIPDLSPHFVFKENIYHMTSEKLPRAVFFTEIRGWKTGSVILYKNELYIIGDMMNAYSLKTGKYTYIGSDELVIVVDDFVHFEMKNKI